MALQTSYYLDQRIHWPSTGRHILAQFDDEGVWVYQAYRHEIADWVLAHGHFGGPWSLQRMSWIKPNFLWMMYRSGWASKEGQERVLAVKLPRSAFDALLNQAVHSAYVEAVYGSQRSWKLAVRYSMVRLQWDPDHNPVGEPLARRAIQLGLRGDTLQRYAREWLLEVEDVTGLATTQAANARPSRYDELVLPTEAVYPVPDAGVAAKLGLGET